MNEQLPDSSGEIYENPWEQPAEQDEANTAEAAGSLPVEHDESTVDVKTDDPRKAEIMDESAEAFHARMNALMEEGRDIVVFRGAGTKNGISPEDLEGAVDKVALSLQESIDGGRKIAIMFDGDEDNREKPDIGAVFGMLADRFKDSPDVVAIAAQQKSWYYPKEEGGVLESATGTPFETFVFPDSMPGGHAALTQSKELAQYDNYKQFFVGPAGAIAADQLRDLNDKADGHTVSVEVIATHNNPNLTQEFEEKLRVAEESGDSAKADNFKATLAQRAEQPYGMMYDANGFKTEATIPSTYPNLNVTMDESLVPEFEEMRNVPARETYVDDKVKAHDKAHVLNDSNGQEEVDYLLGKTLDTSGYNIHPTSRNEAPFAEVSPYYTLAVRDILKRIDSDPQFLEKAVEARKSKALAKLVSLREDDKLDDDEYAARVDAYAREYADVSVMYKNTVSQLIDSSVRNNIARHRSMDG